MTEPSDELTPHYSGWADRFFGAYYARRPVNATFVGHHEFDHELPDWSPNGLADAAAEMRRLLRDLETIPSEPLNRFQTIDRTLARGVLELELWEHESALFQRGNPCLYTGEAIFGVIGLWLTEFAGTGERIEATIERLNAIPRFLEIGRANVPRAPAPWLERAIRECSGAMSLFEDGIDRLIALNRIEAPGFRAAADRALLAFGHHRAELTSMLSRPIGLPNAGSEAVDRYLKAGHHLAQTAAEILAAAETELAQAEANLARLAREPTAKPTSPALEEYYDRYQMIWDSAKAHAIRHDLITWPEFPIRYVPRPEWVRQAAPQLYFLFYRSPAAIDRPPVHDYLVTPIEPSMPPEIRAELLAANGDSAIKLNHVIHHGGIGHHVQNWHAYRSGSRIGRIAAVDCASRIAMFCGGTMAEGWACYATDLMAETGFLTPTERIDEARTRCRMCARAIVDIRFHAGDLSFDEAVEFYALRAGMSDAAARSEVTRNSMFPASALMYQTGTDAIHRLRSQVSARLGSRFVLREFHDQLLSYGSIPVALIATDMLRRIDAAA